MNRSDLPAEIAATIAAQGFDVYMPATGSRTFLFFTDGTRIGYLQRSDWGDGFCLSTVHIPNHTTGTGFRVTDDRAPPLALVREQLERAFIHAPNWADSRARESVRKWASMADFLAGRGSVPLELVAKGVR